METPKKKNDPKPKPSPGSARKVEELADLKQRLETYVLKVRELSDENEDLKKRLALNQGRDGEQLTRKAYEGQMNQLRKEIEDLQKEKALLFRDNHKQNETQSALVTKVAKLEEDLEIEQRRRVEAEQKYATAIDKNLFTEKLMEGRNAQAKDALEESEKNKNEALKAQSERLQKEMLENIESLKKRTEEEKEQLVAMYKELLDEAEEKLNTISVDLANLRVANSTLKEEIKNLTLKVNEQKVENRGLQDKYDDLKDHLTNQITKLTSTIAEKDLEIAALIEKLHIKTQEYDELHRLAIFYNFEIGTLDKLIQNEEKRLGLGEHRPGKRQRFDYENDDLSFQPPTPQLPTQSTQPQPQPEQTYQFTQPFQVPSKPQSTYQPPQPPKFQLYPQGNNYPGSESGTTSEGFPEQEESTTLAMRVVKTGIATIEEIDTQQQFIRIVNLTAVKFYFILILFIF